MSDPGAGVEWVDTAEEEVVVVVTEDGLPPADDTAAGRLEGPSRGRNGFCPGAWRSDWVAGVRGPFVERRKRLVFCFFFLF